MKNTKLLVIILCMVSLISYSQDSIKYHNVIVNSEKSKKWNLPELNITAKIPVYYRLSYNENGQFYLQARKFDKDGNLLATITIEKPDRELKDSNIMEVLRNADVLLSKQLENDEQVNYKTSFIGVELIHGKETKIRRGIIEFIDYFKIMNGKFYSINIPIIIDKNNKFMLSSMFRETENMNKNKIGIELLNFMKTIKAL